MLSLLNPVVEPLLLSITNKILKPPISPPAELAQYQRSLDHSAKRIFIQSGQHRMTAYRVELNNNRNLIAKKLAFIYVCGNGEYVAFSCHSIIALFKQLIKKSQSANQYANYALYFQDYRGKGANQCEAKDNFNNYTLSQDATDQAELIKQVVAEGYAPENIVVMGFSLGSGVALWALQNTLQELGVAFKKIRIICDRGYGNLLEHHLVSPFLSNPKETSKKLIAAGMLPEQPLHDIARTLPNSLVINAQNDTIISPPIALASTFQSGEMPGRVWMVHADENNAHCAWRMNMHLKGLHDVNFHHLLTAIIHQIPINLDFKQSITTGFRYEYTFKKHETLDVSYVPLDHDEFEVKLPSQLRHNGLFNKAKNALTQMINPAEQVTVAMDNTVLRDLDNYIKTTVALANHSGNGMKYKSGLLFKEEWSLGDKAQMAAHLMRLLCNDKNPDVAAILKLQNTSGAHQSGELNTIYKRIVLMTQDIENINDFNEWVDTFPKDAFQYEGSPLNVIGNKLFYVTTQAFLFLFRQLNIISGSHYDALTLINFIQFAGSQLRYFYNDYLEDHMSSFASNLRSSFSQFTR